MRLDTKATAITGGLVWSSVMLLTGVMNLVWAGYGEQLLQVMASLYPGFHAGSFGQVLLGTCYGFFDGAILGLLVALAYNASHSVTAKPA